MNHNPTLMSSSKKLYLILGALIYTGVLLFFIISDKKFFAAGLLSVPFFVLLLGLDFDKSMLIFIYLGMGIPAAFVLYKIPLGSISLYVGEILLFLCLFILIRTIITNNKKKLIIPINTINVAVILYLLITTVAFFRGLEVSYINSRRVFRMSFVYLSAIPFSAFLYNKKNAVKAIESWYKSTFIYIFIYIFMFWMPLFLSAASSTHRYRLSVQMLLVCMFVYVIQKIIIEKPKIKNSIVYILFFVGAMWCILFAQDRSVWVSLIMALSVYFTISFFMQKGVNRLKYTLIMVSILVVTAIVLLYLLPLVSDDYSFIIYVLKKRIGSIRYLKYDPSWQLRNIFRKNTIELWLQYPLIGNGFGDFTGHDNYFMILYESGILGIIPWLMIYAAMGYYYLYSMLNLKFIDDKYLKAFIISQAACFPAWLAIFYVEALIRNEMPAAFGFFLSASIAWYVKEDIKKKKKLIQNTEG